MWSFKRLAFVSGFLSGFLWLVDWRLVLASVAVLAVGMPARRLRAVFGSLGRDGGTAPVVGTVLMVSVTLAFAIVAAFFLGAAFPGRTADGLVGVRDRPADLDGDGVRDGSVVEVVNVAESLEGARLSVLAGPVTLRAAGGAVEGAAVFVPCGVWQGPVQVVVATERVSDVWVAQVAQEMHLAECPGSALSGGGSSFGGSADSWGEDEGSCGYLDGWRILGLEPGGYVPCGA